jgi:hypothetical protein
MSKPSLSQPIQTQRMPDMVRDRDKIIDELETKLVAAEARERVLREALEWMDRKGGLGLDVHDRIRAALSAHKPVIT